MDSGTIVTEMTFVSGRLRRALPAVVGLGLFLAALEALRIELRSVSWSEVTLEVARLPHSRLALAVALTVLNYVALTGYDLLGFAYIGRTLPRRRVAFTSLLAYAVANSVGFAMLSGASVRYRFYRRWGVTPEELSRIVFSYSVTFWLGLLALGGLSLVAAPVTLTTTRSIREAIPAGWALMLAPIGYVVATTDRQRPLQLGRLGLPVPQPAIAIAQLILSCVEWSVAGAVLYVLLPQPALGFLPFLALFFVAILVGLASHVPGGLGVFETLMVLVLRPYVASSQVLPALVVYRIIYYLIPLTVALAVLAADELHQRREDATRVGAMLDAAAVHVTPRVLAVATFLAGLVLLFSGAMPAAQGRLALVGRVLPVGVVEVSHFAGSVAGAALLLLSHGLWRRLDGACYVTLALVMIGIIASLFKGFDYEEATLLLIVLIALWRARPAFSRRAAFFETRFSPAWIAAVSAAVAASLWLGLFAFKHVQYSNELWWQFELYGDAPRFLRAVVGAAVVLVLFGLSQLVGHARCRIAAPGDADLRDAEKAIAAQIATSPNLVFLRDKAVVFDRDRRAFVMYGVHRRTWVALGDPVGPEECLTGTAQRFLERCDDFGGVPVFYEVTKDHLHRYVDLGLTLIKLGESASVPLSTFQLERGHGARHRQVLRRLERDGVSFRIVPPTGVPTLLGELRAVSDEWLAAKAAAEKGFSLGFFDEAYLARFPVAVLERDARIEAFATIWPGPQRVEASADLMRYRRTAPRDAMQGLFVHLLMWAKAEGYQRFGLGMAPLSGFQQSPVAPFWNRLARLLYRHGGSVYNFQGLRAYKDKFDPVWEPQYLAYPGGPRLPLILADVAALIAGGYRRIFIK
jgi:phosphatidylglycerol lysyltransferase